MAEMSSEKVRAWLEENAPEPTPEPRNECHLRLKTQLRDYLFHQGIERIDEQALFIDLDSEIETHLNSIGQPS